MKLFACLFASALGNAVPIHAAADPPVRRSVDLSGSLYHYDFRGHDFPVSVQDKDYFYTVMNDHVYQFSVGNWQTYDLGEFDHEDISYGTITRYYRNGELDICSRHSKVIIKCNEDPNKQEVSYVESVKEPKNCNDDGPEGDYEIHLKLPCQKLPDDASADRVHKDGCPHTANVKFDDGKLGENNAFQPPGTALRYFFFKNHVWLRDGGKQSNDPDYNLDLGYYQKTSKDFLTRDDLKKSFDSYLDNHPENDKDEYTSVRLYQYGKLVNGKRRMSVVYLKCGTENKILSVAKLNDEDVFKDADFGVEGYFLRVSLNCAEDQDRPEHAPWDYPVCPDSKKCILKDDDGILLTECQ